MSNCSINGTSLLHSGLVLEASKGHLDNISTSSFAKGITISYRSDVGIKNLFATNVGLALEVDESMTLIHSMSTSNSISGLNLIGSDFYGSTVYVEEWLATGHSGLLASIDLFSSLVIRSSFPDSSTTSSKVADGEGFLGYISNSDLTTLGNLDAQRMSETVITIIDSSGSKMQGIPVSAYGFTEITNGAGEVTLPLTNDFGTEVTAVGPESTSTVIMIATDTSGHTLTLLVGPVMNQPLSLIHI